jgi:hypothetical protein
VILVPAGRGSASPIGQRLLGDRIFVSILAISGAGCDPRIVVGSDTSDDGGLTPLVVPWSTGFENGVDDWSQPASQGFCYAVGNAQYQIVAAPVHSGKQAAAFTVNTGGIPPPHTRCLRQGVLPDAAYYGAWYYVPAPATNFGNWNLLHFQGANVADGAVAHGLWDVSLTSGPDGALDTSVYDFLRMRQLEAGTAIPIATWFHLEVFLRRAPDGTGRFTLTRDGDVVLDLNGIETDDSLWGQWFVGNLATALLPPSSTVYVDDITIGLMPSP